MSLYSEEQIRQAKSVDLLSYLQRASPSELVRVSGSTWCLKDHDSLRISNGKCYWFSRGFGGSSAVNFLVNVRGFSFLEAVGAVLENGTYQIPVKNEPSERRLLLPPKSKTADRVMEYLQRRAIDPEIIQACIVPCLMCSREGSRLGQCGGYYDRFLPECGNAAVILAAFEAQRAERLPREETDIPMDWIVTEEAVYRPED